VWQILGGGGLAEASCAVGSCGEPGALRLMVLRATTEASRAVGSSAMGSCGESGTRAPHVHAVGSAEASCAVGSAGDSVPMRRPHAWRVPAAGLVEASCAVSFRGGLGACAGEFQAGSCSVEALSLSGGIGVARVGACGSDGVELGLAASRSGGVSVG
jgi:hypothetical protein